MDESQLAYNGYTGSIEHSTDDACFHGRVLAIDDLITYEGDTIDALRAAFVLAVDRYLGALR